MIARETVEQIQRLLAEGNVSQRGIARLMGVSRGTVNAIAQGKRREPRPAKPEEEDLPCGPPQRCPTCGGFVYMPCRLCRVRESLIKNPIRRRPDALYEAVRLELNAEQQKRYQEIHAQRVRSLRSNGAVCAAEEHSHEV
jgi:hypothetical protein